MNSVSFADGDSQQVKITLVGTCPSCHHHTRFTYAGEQHWPEEVARAAGVPSAMKLWHCEYCHSTITEPEMDMTA